MLESAGLSVARVRSQMEDDQRKPYTKKPFIDRSKTPLMLNKAQKPRFELASTHVSQRSELDIKIPWGTRLAPLNQNSDYKMNNLKLSFNDLNHQAKLKNLENLRRS